MWADDREEKKGVCVCVCVCVRETDTQTGEGQLSQPYRSSPFGVGFIVCVPLVFYHVIACNVLGVTGHPQPAGSHSVTSYNDTSSQSLRHNFVNHGLFVDKIGRR